MQCIEYIYQIVNKIRYNFKDIIKKKNKDPTANS